MKFGVAILGSEPSDEIIRTIQSVERLGYDVAWFPDEKFYRDVYALLALCALNSKRLAMGTAVTDPYVRSPVLTAAAIATISEASDGRAVLGIGAGGAPQLKSIGIDQKNPVQAISEAVEVIRLLTKSDSPVTYQGATIQLSNVRLNFKCRHNIPIYIASRGPKTLELAGEVGDGAIIGSLSSADGLRYALKCIAKGSEKAGRSTGDIEIVSWVYSSIGDTDEARESVKPIIAASVYNSRRILGDIGISRELAVPIIETVENHRGPAHEAHVIASKYVSEELLDKFSMTGTPEECRRKVEEIAASGVNQISIVPHSISEEGNKRTIELFAKEVMSEFKQ